MKSKILLLISGGLLIILGIISYLNNYSENSPILLSIFPVLFVLGIISDLFSGSGSGEGRPARTSSFSNSSSQGSKTLNEIDWKAVVRVVRG